MIRVGDKISDIELRTDEGTPLSLADLHGRALALFLLGKTFTPSIEHLLLMLAQNTGRFLAFDVSPIAVVGVPASQLAAFREQNDMPFILVSDPNYILHHSFMEKDGRDVEVWIVDQHGIVVEMVPMLPPAELISLAINRARRVHTKISKAGR